MLPRCPQAALSASLAREAAVAVLGPRRVGKTTLASEDVQPRRALMVHAGEDRCPKSAAVEVIGLRELVQDLIAYSLD